MELCRTGMRGRLIVFPIRGREIKKAARVFLTLHGGGSGTDDTDFRNAITAGTNIIHINTELRVAWRQSLEESLNRQQNEVVPYKILPLVIASVKEVVVSRLKSARDEGTKDCRLRIC